MSDYEMYDAAAMAGLGAFSAVYSIVALVWAVAQIVGMWKVFTKAGKPGWGAIVPFYNMYCLFEMSFGNGWLFLLLFVPCVNFVFAIMYCFKMAKAFGQEWYFGLGLLFLQPIFIMILGFGKAEYVGVNN